MKHSSPRYFSTPARMLHWLMAPLILAMLFIGIFMVTTVSSWHQTLLMIHRPLGIAIFVLVVIRMLVRLTSRTPQLPDGMPSWQKGMAHASHMVFYVLLLVMPLIGWGMLSAGGYPIFILDHLALPAILPESVRLYSALRSLHTYCAILLLLTFCGHFSAALFHGLIRRDGVFSSMASVKSRHE